MLGYTEDEIKTLLSKDLCVILYCNHWSLDAVFEGVSFEHSFLAICEKN